MVATTGEGVPAAGAGTAACPDCDLVVAIPSLRPGERALCSRCGALLESRSRNGLAGPAAFAAAGLLFLGLSVGFPFLGLRASGLREEVSLLETLLTLHREGQTAVAAAVFTTVVVVPAAVLATLLAVAAAVRRGRRPAWCRPAARALVQLSEWSMAEVFLLAVLVSLVKLSDLASVRVGAAFWGYLGLALSLSAALAGLDRRSLWRGLEGDRA